MSKFNIGDRVVLKMKPWKSSIQTRTFANEVLSRSSKTLDG